MDDESYFPMTGQNIPGNDGYYSSDKSKVDPEVRYKSKPKFPSKVLVWIAISSSGHSNVYFAKRNSITAEVYSKQCIIKCLDPFLKKNHSNGQYVFWPDGASAHYAKQTIQTFERLNIKYVPKDRNPPNIPQLCSIEKF